jgi:hypothetical protein
MNDEPILSVTDVAEILQSTIEDVRANVERGELVHRPNDRLQFAYSEVVRFIDIRNQSRLALGLHDAQSTDFVMLRPRVE